MTIDITKPGVLDIFQRCLQAVHLPNAEEVVLDELRTAEADLRSDCMLCRLLLRRNPPMCRAWPQAKAERASDVTTWVTLASVAIKRFRHKGLELFFISGAKAGIQAQHADRLRLILGRLNASTNPYDMNLPGLNLHELQGSRKGVWAVKVSGNWRVTFAFAGKDVDRVNYEDYH